MRSRTLILLAMVALAIGIAHANRGGDLHRLRATEDVVMDVPNGESPDFSVVITTGTIITIDDSAVEQQLLSSKSFVDADAPVSE